MKAHGVQGPSLHCDLELKISYQNLFEQGGVSLGCKPAWWMKKGCTGLLRSSACLGGRLVPFVSRLVPSLACCSKLVRRCCASCWGRDLKWVCSLCFWEISPTLILVPVFIQPKNKRWKQARTLPVANTGESKILLNKYLKSLILFLLFILFYYFMFFYHGKLGMIG